MASAADVETWCEDHPGGNIGLRLPAVAIGIDADTWKGPAAAEAWDNLLRQFGPLPAEAPWCTSRDDGVSGIRLFAVPGGYRAVTDLGEAGEVIQHHHRYVVAPPSIHPGTGKPYRWVNAPDGRLPDARKLPPLPPAWLAGLRAGNPAAIGDGKETDWTDPDIDHLIAEGIRDGAQDKQLRDVVWKLRSRLTSKPQTEAVWKAIVARTPLLKPDPWTAADFERHWAGADHKQGRLSFPIPAAAVVTDRSGVEVPARRLVLTPASEITPEPVVWAWEQFGQGRIPGGSVGLFAGREGTGKSSFLIWTAAQVTRGELPGSFKGGPRPVIYVTFEDSWKFTIVPRLMAAGADLTLVYRAEVEAIDGDTYSLSLPADNKLLEEAITSHRVALVVIDPLLSAISDVLDTHVNRKVRQALDPLASLADRTGAVIAGIAHFSKSTGTDASSLITGSGAFKDVARFIFAFATDEDDSGVVTQTKNSLGHSNLPSLAYRIIEAIVPTAKGDARVGRLVLEGEAERTVRDILATRDGSEEQDEKTRAEDYLKRVLADGPRRTTDVEDGAKGNAIAKRTLDRARRALRIPAAKHEDGWWISLPEHEGDLTDLPRPAKTAKVAKPATRGNVGNLGILDPHCERCAAPISPLRLAQAGQLCGRCETVGVAR